MMPWEFSLNRRRHRAAILFVSILLPCGQRAAGKEDRAAELAGGQGAQGADCNQNAVPDDADLQPVNPVLEVEGEIAVEDFRAAAQLRFADLDQDGDLDLLGVSHQNDTLALFRNDGTGSFSSPSLTTLESSPAEDVLEDLDGDGDLDFAFVGYGNAHAFWIHFNAGDGTFPAFDGYPLDAAVFRLAAADLDGDGALDLVLGRQFLPGVYAYRNLGAGKLAGTVLLEELRIQALASGDLDGDLDFDLAALTEAGSTALLNDGSGNLSSFPITAGDSLADLAGDDVDDDGDLDLAAISDEGDLLLYSNRGDATFEATPQVLSQAPHLSISVHRLKYGMARADLDGDGRRDLLVLCTGRWDSGAISFLKSLGGGAFAAGTIIAKVRPYATALAVYDPGAGDFLVAASRWDGAGVAFLKKGVGANSRDCNRNGSPDECDVVDRPGEDCDQNGIPDSCEDLSDCNQNGFPDRCDLFSFRVTDCNQNRVSDACDLAQGASLDRNEDGVPDECHEPVSDLFRMSFEGCPDRLLGAPGEEKTFEVFPVLKVEGNQDPEGPGGWLASIEVEGAVVESTSFDGLSVSTIYDHDGDSQTPPLDPYELQLKDAGFRATQKAMGDHLGTDPDPFSGAYSVVLLNLSRKQVLQPSGVYPMARMRIKVKIPDPGEAPATVRLRYRNGLYAGGERVENLVLLGSTYWIPRSEACTFQAAAAQPYLRCDANDDLRVDISDPVWILNELFGGGNGSRTRCQLASDCNGDGQKDISDAITGLSFLFTGGRAPPPPFPGCGTGDETSTCDPGSTACP